MVIIVSLHIKYFPIFEFILKHLLASNATMIKGINIHKSYDNLHVLKGVNLNVEKGEDFDTLELNITLPENK